MSFDFQNLCVAVFAEEKTEEIVSEIYRFSGIPLVAMRDVESSIAAVTDRMMAGKVDVMLCLSADAVSQAFNYASKQDQLESIRDVLRRIVIGSMDTDTTDALQKFSISSDFDSNRLQAPDLIAAVARICNHLVLKKQSAVDAGIDTTCWRRTDMVWPLVEDRHNSYEESAFLKACRGEPVDYTPIWLMRQAGRYQREYHHLRSSAGGFLDLCKTPELAAEVTLMATERLGVDAAIIFSDILPILQPMGFDLEYLTGTGPVIHNPLTLHSPVDQIPEVDVQALSYVYEAIRMTRRALPPAIPLIGFSGAPFTLAAYAIEGGASRNYQQTKLMMYDDPGTWHAFMAKLARGVTAYLNEQIAAGAQTVQLFDSWVGCLSPDDYREFVMPYASYIFSHLTPNVPAIHFGTGTGALLKLMQEAGGTVIGIDWRVDLSEARSRLGYETPVQGNLDPLILFASRKEIEKRAKEILHKAEGRAGHIFNLGHGILPGTPEDSVAALIDVVHEYRM